MPDFDRHLRFGLIAHAGLTSAAALGYLLALSPGALVGLVGAALPATVTGAVAPDLDHHDSRPYCVVRHIGPLAVAAVTLVALVPRHGTVAALVAPLSLSLPPTYVAGFLTAATAFWVRSASARLIPLVRPPHRTLLHRPAAAPLTAALPVVVAGRSLDVSAAETRLVAALCGGCYAVGFLVHLYLDGELPLRGD